MNEFLVKIALDDADRARLDALISSIHRLADATVGQPQATPAPLPPALMDAAFNQFLARQDRQTRIERLARVAGVHPDDKPADPPAPDKMADQVALADPPAAPPAEAAAEIIPLPDFQSAIAKKCAEAPAMKAAVRQLVNKYAPSVSEIPEEKRAEVMAELTKLKV